MQQILTPDDIKTKLRLDEMVMFERVRERAKEKALQNMLLKYYTLVLEEAPETEYHSYPDFKDKLDYIKKKQDDKEQTVDYFWFVISPKSDCTFEQLQEKVKKCLQKKWIVECMYSFEQRSEDPNTPYGFHVNMLISKNGKAKQEAVRELTSTFKSIIGENCKNAIYCAGISKQLAEQKRSYMMGCKSHDKKELVEADRVWRSQNGIDEYYNFHKDIEN